MTYSSPPFLQLAAKPEALTSINDLPRVRPGSTGRIGRLKCTASYPQQRGAEADVANLAQGLGYAAFGALPSAIHPTRWRVGGYEKAAKISSTAFSWLP